MIFKETTLEGAFIVEPEEIGDTRGFFARMWCQKEFKSRGLNPDLVQCNLSYNNHIHTIRGMHFQAAPYQETKLVRCTRGKIFDVIIDLRPGSATYLSWIGAELTADNRKMLYVPEGFAHGYQTLTDHAEVFYQVSQFYMPEYERGVKWDDASFAIEWPQTEDVVVSEKDSRWPGYIPHKAG